ncbi:MAG: dockerin type I domain-containing protein [Planctomycetota bacterium]
MRSTFNEIGMVAGVVALAAGPTFATDPDGLVRWTEQRVRGEACTFAGAVVPEEEFSVSQLGVGSFAPCGRGDYLVWSFTETSIELNLAAPAPYVLPLAFVDIRFEIPEGCSVTVEADGVDAYWSGPAAPSQPIVMFASTAAKLGPGAHRIEAVLFDGSLTLDFSGGPISMVGETPFMVAHAVTEASGDASCVDPYFEEPIRSDAQGLVAGIVSTAVFSPEINEACFDVFETGTSAMACGINGASFSIAGNATCGSAARSEYELVFSIDRPHLVYWTAQGAYSDRPQIRRIGGSETYTLPWRSELLDPPVILPTGDYRMVNADGWMRDCSFTSANGFLARYAPADIEVDGKVNALDLVAVLSNWGPVVGPPSPADVDFDGVVSTADLAIVLGEWGTTGSRLD